MIPFKEVFVSKIMDCISKIGKSVINASKLIDFEGVLRDVEKYGFSLIKYIKIFFNFEFKSFLLFFELKL